MSAVTRARLRAITRYRVPCGALRRIPCLNIVTAFILKKRPPGLVTPVEVDSALPVIVGTAPVHNLAEDVSRPVNEPKLIYSLPDFVAQFGAPGGG